MDARSTSSLTGPLAPVDAGDATWFPFDVDLAGDRMQWLRCDEAAAVLRVSGVFSLNNSDQALAVLARTLPVRVRRVTPYWVNVALA